MRLIPLLALALLTACGSPSFRDTTVPMTAQADFDVTRYLGTWYEIARFPVSFQQSCTATTATYGFKDDTTITVLNQCKLGEPWGPVDQIKGTADIVGPGQLSVKFFRIPFVRGDYWVLWVDDAYETAVVGVPNGRAGWILARSPEISPEKRSRAEEVFRRNGYDPARLTETAHVAE